jgi:hypothetical protein
MIASYQHPILNSYTGVFESLAILTPLFNLNSQKNNKIGGLFAITSQKIILQINAN